MTYDTAGEAGYDGELYFHYDHFGNTTLLSNTNGDPVFSAQYDPCRGTTQQTWNTSNLEIINQGQGRYGTLSMTLPGSNTAMVHSSGTITISEETISAFVARAGTKLVCYLDNGNCMQESNDGHQCVEQCGFFSCNRLFSLDDQYDTDTTELRYDFAPTEYNCTLMQCCRNFIYNEKLAAKIGNDKVISENGDFIPIAPDVYDERTEHIQEWWDKHGKECWKFLK